MQRKAVFIDIDGTLVDHNGVIPASARSAIAAARARGHAVLLASGRSVPELWDDLMAIGFDGVIGGAGAYVEVGGTVLADDAFAPDLLRRVVGFLSDADAPYLLEGSAALWANDAMRAWGEGFLRRRFPDTDARAAARRGACCFIDRMEPLPATPPHAGKVIFLETPSATLDAARARFGDEIDVLGSSLAVYGQPAGELAMRGVHKAMGVRLVAEHLGLDAADTVALGDSDNDLEMLAAAGLGIAMGGAAPHVVAAADATTDAPEDDGLARAFERHGLV